VALPPPFGKPINPLLIDHPDMGTGLSSLRSQDSNFTNMGVMLVDLTLRVRVTAGVTARYNFAGGWNQGLTRYSGSLVKIAAMFAAYRLRQNVRDAAAGLRAKDGKDLLGKIRDDWKPIVETAVKAGPKDFPHLDTIFTVTGASGGWTINFDTTFEKNLKNMIGPSSNSAAQYCIDALEFQYINGALAAEGFYSDADGGMWLGGDYAKGRSWPAEPKSKSHQAASPASVARFLTLLEGNQLVSPDASNKMRGLMNNFYTKRALDANSRPLTMGFGKLGIGVPSSPGYHDGCVVERSVGGKTIRYAVVMLQANVVNFTVVNLALGLDDIVLAQQGLPVP
jgi:hypothetical protein